MTLYEDTRVARERVKWGSEYDTLLDAAKAANPERVTMGVLLAILEIMDTMIGAVAEREISKRLNRVGSSVCRYIEKEIESREDKHGPCPEGLRQRLHNDAMGRWHYWILNRNTFGEFADYRPPVKGSDARKEYDAWMRRKTKPGART